MITIASPLQPVARRAASAVKLAVFDVDGVLTDGGLLYSAEGETLKRFDVRDGLGLKLLQAAGIAVAVITARDSAALRRRLKDLAIVHVITGCSAKRQALQDLARRLDLELSQVAYTGDDLVDLTALQIVGCPISVDNAHPLLKNVALFTTTRRGGDGAVREIAESLIGSQQDFEQFVSRHLNGEPDSLAFTVVIPARFAASRLPGKPLLPLAGKPMIQHVYQNACKAGAEDVLVATDDPRILEAVRKFGGKGVLTSAEHLSGTDRIAEVASNANWPDERIVVNLQGDEPLIEHGPIYAVASLLGKRIEAGISTLATPIHEAADLFDPNVVKVVLDATGLAQYFSRAPIPWSRDAFAALAAARKNPLPRGVAYLRHLGLYAYRVKTLKQLSDSPKSNCEQAESLEQLRALSLGIRIAVQTMDSAPGHGVDTPADLARIEKLLGERALSPKGTVSGETVIEGEHSA